MKLYLAPLEGITGYVYRQAYHACYEDADKYFTPFLAPHTKRSFNARERNDLIPEHVYRATGAVKERRRCGSNCRRAESIWLSGN